MIWYPICTTSTNQSLMRPTFANRAIAQLQEEGTNPYPHKFHATISIPDFVAKFQDVEVGEKQVHQYSNQAVQSCAG